MAAAARAAVATTVGLVQAPTPAPRNPLDVLIDALNAPVLPPSSLPRVSQHGVSLSVSVDSSSEKEKKRRVFDDNDRKCDPRVANYITGKKLGEGSFKTVYELCDDATCTAASNVLQVVSMSQPSNVAELRKEVQLMKQVQDATTAKKRPAILLPIKSYIECAATQKAFLVQERADATLEDVGEKQFKRFASERNMAVDDEIPSLLFTRAQLLEAFRLAQRLYREYGGLVHGDLKPDNVLVRGDRVYIADFGLSGALRGDYNAFGAPRAGFSRNLGCPHKIPSSPQLRSYYNVWQLELLLRAYYVTLVEFPATVGGYRELRRFESVDLLGDRTLVIPPLARLTLDESCTRLRQKFEETSRRFDMIRNHFVSKLFKTNSLDKKVENEITAEEAVVQAIARIDTPEYVATTPLWARYVIRQGLGDTLYQSKIIFASPVPLAPLAALAAEPMRIAGLF